VQILKEPCRLTEYITTGHGIDGRLFTCGRPGRSMGAKVAKISHDVVNVWLNGLPSSTGETVIVSLLGRKPRGPSEFTYYSFRGGFDQPQDRPGCPTWQEWLKSRYGSRYRVCEFPTIDTEDIPESTKKVLFKTILEFIQAGKTVLVADSGGVGRTGRVITTTKKFIEQLSAKRRWGEVKRHLRANFTVAHPSETTPLQECSAQQSIVRISKNIDSRAPCEGRCCGHC
jgi:hypothetical protein